MSSIWTTLSAINVNDHTKDKGGFTYLAWTFAWAEVKKIYPDANYRLLEDKVYADGTVEVRCEVTISNMTHPMWLPVTDHRNKAIPTPNAFDVNTARMRCLVKCLAMFGLGHYIYAGESVPAAPPLPESVRDELLLHMSANDAQKFVPLYRGLTEEHRDEFFDSFSKGNKTQQKNLVRGLLAQWEDIANDYANTLSEHVISSDDLGVRGLVEELADDDDMKQAVWARLPDSDRAAIKSMMKSQ